jgi:hypothetical protein
VRVAIHQAAPNVEQQFLHRSRLPVPRQVAEATVVIIAGGRAERLLFRPQRPSTDS